MFESVVQRFADMTSGKLRLRSSSRSVQDKKAVISNTDEAVRAAERQLASAIAQAARHPSSQHEIIIERTVLVSAGQQRHKFDTQRSTPGHPRDAAEAPLQLPPSRSELHAEEKASARRTALLHAMQLAVPPEVATKSYPAGLVPLWSQEGLALLEGSVGRFETVAAHMLGQGPLQCGVTSLAIALNVCKRRGDPTVSVAELHEDLRAALQPASKFFSASLAEIAALAMRHASGDVSIIYASDTDCNAFRAMASETLETGGSVVVNFKRSELGYASPFAGHCSPLAAYNPGADEFLVMDVARKSFQPVWVPATTLFRGMDTMEKPRDDRQPATKTRGFILLDPAHAPPRFYA